MEGPGVTWFKSRDWFGLMGDRYTQVLHAQKTLARFTNIPLNYGTLTLVLLHMLKSVLTCPRPLSGPLRDALKDLHVDDSRELQGVWFVAELNLDERAENPLPQVEPHDTAQVLTDLRVAKSVVREAEEEDARRARARAGRGRVPSGPTATWAALKDMIETDPQQVMEPFVFPSGLSSVSDMAQRLFMLMTTNFFNCLATEHAVRTPVRKPVNVEEAMELWTVGAVGRRLINVKFKANHSRYGEAGNIQHVSFREMRKLLFPPLEQLECAAKNSLWRIVRESEGGYLRVFYDERTDAHKDPKVLDGLDTIFRYLHCLPVVSLPSEDGNAHGRMWHCSGAGGIEVWANPRYYTIESLSKKERARADEREEATHRGLRDYRTLGDQLLADFEDRTVEEVRTDRAAVKSGGAAGRAAARKQENKRRDNKTKNARKPPQRKRKEAPVSAEEEDGRGRLEAEERAGLAHAGEESEVHDRGAYEPPRARTAARKKAAGPTKTPVGAGLRNEGRRCFLNAVLQSLMHVAPVARLLQEEPNTDHGKCRSHGNEQGLTERPAENESKDATGCGICEMRKLFKETRKEAAVNPSGMLRLLKGGDGSVRCL